MWQKIQPKSVVKLITQPQSNSAWWYCDNIKITPLKFRILKL